MANWEVTKTDGSTNVLNNVAFRQRIRNPDGQLGDPVPLDNDILEVVVTDGTTVQIRCDKLAKITKNTDNYTFLAEEKILGNLESDYLSEVVMVGFLSDSLCTIRLDDVEKASIQGQNLQS